MLRTVNYFIEWLEILENQLSIQRANSLCTILSKFVHFSVDGCILSLFQGGECDQFFYCTCIIVGLCILLLSHLFMYMFEFKIVCDKCKKKGFVVSDSSGPLISRIIRIQKFYAIWYTGSRILIFKILNFLSLQPYRSEYSQYLTLFFTHCY